jgi:hypothetical protein
LRMICSAVCLVRFMVRSPAQSGRMRTLIHPGSIARVHVKVFWADGALAPSGGELLCSRWFSCSVSAGWSVVNEV